MSYVISAEQGLKLEILEKYENHNDQATAIPETGVMGAKLHEEPLLKSFSNITILWYQEV